jgi:hypothetical protein
MSWILAIALQDGLEDARRLMERSAELLHELRAARSVPLQEEILRILQKKIDEARAAEPKAEPRREPRRADRPYVAPRRETPRSKFEAPRDAGGWGDLPPRLREAILHAARDLDSYPPELRAPMEDYFRRLSRGE